MSWITSAEFSRRMGCSRANVTQAIGSGRIRPEHVRRDGTRVMVNTAAIPDWRATASKRRGINEPVPPGPIPAPHPSPMPVPMVEGLPPPAWGAGGEEQSCDAGLSAEEIKEQMARVPVGGLPEMALSRARREHFLAEMAQLELEREQQKLVSAAKMRRVHYDAGRLVRDAVLRVPVRVMPELAAAAGGLSPDQRQVIRTLLERHLVKALESLVQKQIESGGAEQG